MSFEQGLLDSKPLNPKLLGLSFVGFRVKGLGV